MWKLYVKRLVVLRNVLHGRCLSLGIDIWMGKSVKLVLALILFLPILVHAAAVPAHSPVMGQATGGLIAQKVAQRGFAANDPRIAATVSGVGAALTGIASGVAVGATWPAILAAAGVSAVVSGVMPLLVEKTINWLWGTGDQAQVSGSDMVATVPSTPIFGSTCTNACALTYMSPGESRYFQTPTAGVISLLMVKFIQGVSWSYTGMLDMSGNTINTAPAGGDYWKSQMVQTSGYTKVDGTVIPAPSGGAYVLFTHFPPTGVPEVATYVSTMKSTSQVIADLPQSAVSAHMSDASLAAAVNTLWRAASLQPAYPGVPWDATNPVTPTDVAAWKAANPSLTPTLSDYIAPAVDPTSHSVQVPLPTSNTNPNVSNPGIGGTKVDLGADPGIPAPNLEATPTGTQIFQPIKDGVSGWSNFTVPVHSATCPTSSFSWWGRTHSFDAHCTLIDSNQSTIHSAMMALWVLVALFIVLGA